MTPNQKTRLGIFILSIYCIGLTYFGAWLYSIGLSDIYKTAFWTSVIIHVIAIYAIIGHRGIEGK